MDLPLQCVYSQVFAQIRKLASLGPRTLGEGTGVHKDKGRDGGQGREQLLDHGFDPLFLDGSRWLSTALDGY
jgi:hypothetical protein